MAENYRRGGSRLLQFIFVFFFGSRGYAYQYGNVIDLQATDREDNLVLEAEAIHDNALSLAETGEDAMSLFKRATEASK